MRGGRDYHGAVPRHVLVALVLIASLGLAACGGGGGASTPTEALARDCSELADDAARECYREEFDARVQAASDPVAEVEEITAESRDAGGFLLSNCHGIMHAVGRSHVAIQNVTLASLMDHLPRSNDPGCAAGFAHGVVTAVAPQLDLSDPRARRPSAGRPRRATSVTAASTASGTPSCG
jgi:hypothetical protein